MMSSPSTKAAAFQVREISPDNISPNPDNPRLVFRNEELETLLQSIKKYGIQVPITVYEEDGHFVLIDGERRWRCSRKLNLRKVPALVQPKPSELDNLLLMFNIHALREQWDYLTIAGKLPKIISLFSENNGREPNEIELSEITGLTRGQIRRCRLLLDLPDPYRDQLFTELALPKQKQRLSEDFFIEMERSLKTVEKRVPNAIPDIDKARDSLIVKYRNRTINNVVDLRKISKIATAVASLGVDQVRAERALKLIFNSNNNRGINEVYSAEFEAKYDEKKIIRNVESVSNYLADIDGLGDLEDPSGELREMLVQLQAHLSRVLGG
jgi:ParB family chromosome partitioning protein